MDNNLNTVFFIISVNFLISRFIELFEHLWGDKGAVSGTPVIVVEEGIRF